MYSANYVHRSLPVTRHALVYKNTGGVPLVRLYPGSLVHRPEEQGLRRSKQPADESMLHMVQHHDMLNALQLYAAAQTPQTKGVLPNMAHMIERPSAENLEIYTYRHLCSHEWMHLSNTITTPDKSSKPEQLDLRRNGAS
jgi:hypothetical protein